MQNDRIPASAQFIDTYFPTIDGVVRTVHSYAENMNKSGYCCVVAPHQKGENDSVFSYDVLRTKSMRFFMAEYRLPEVVIARKVKRALREREFDIFHVHSPVLMSRLALREAKRRNIPIVVTFHSKYYDDVLKMSGSKFIAKRAVNNIIKFYNKCDSVWAVSEGTAQTLRSYGYKGDIFVTGNGTDYVYPENADFLAENARNLLGIEPDMPIVLFIGHQIWQKNIKLVLDTTKCLLEKGVRFKTVIVGAGYAEKEIKAYAQSLKLGDAVLFTGQIEDKQILQGIELASSLFFFPSVYDNAPLVVREAAAMGLPAMLMKGSNSAENTYDGENAFHCVDDAHLTAEKIEALLAKPEKLREVGSRAKQTLGKPWSEILPSVVEKYNLIIEEKKNEKN